MAEQVCKHRFQVKSWSVHIIHLRLRGRWYKNRWQCSFSLSSNNLFLNWDCVSRCNLLQVLPSVWLMDFHSLGHNYELVLFLTTWNEKLKHVQYLHFILVDHSYFIVIQFHIIVLWFLTCMNINQNGNVLGDLKARFLKYLGKKISLGWYVLKKQSFYKSENYWHVIVFSENAQ